jgi:hypothetical protein
MLMGSKVCLSLLSSKHPCPEAHLLAQRVKKFSTAYGSRSFNSVFSRDKKVIEKTGSEEGGGSH